MLTRDEIIERYSRIPWVSPYERVVALADPSGEYVELHEFHARGKCAGGSAWEVYHYSRSSPLVLNARREGARNIFLLRVGEAELDLIPGIRGAGIERVEVLEKEGEIRITYAGLAGAGVAVTLCRGMAEGVKGVEIGEVGGGAKLGRATLVLPLLWKVTFGVDDTDNREAGATWSLVNEIGYELDERGFPYLLHVIVQLYTKNPHRTTNCVSIASSFAVEPSRYEEIVEEFCRRVEERTLSDNTTVAYTNRILIPDSLREYGNRVKSSIVSIEEARELARRLGIEYRVITGERGLIGALAALAFSDDPDRAVEVVA